MVRLRGTPNSEKDVVNSRPDLFATVPRSEFDIPGRSHGLLDVVRWRYLLQLLVRTGVTTRYRNSVLGWTWSYVRPAAQFLVFWVVMGLFLRMQGSTPNYVIYLFSGIIVINLFSEAFKNATTSIVGNAALVRKVFLPRQLFAVSSVIVALVHVLPQVALLTIIVLFMGWLTHASFFAIGALIAAIVIITVFALGLGLFFGAINVRFRDSENIVELLLLLATWASPVLYVWTMVETAVKELGWPHWILELYLLNPITQSVELFHYGFWRPTLADPVIPIPPNLGINTLWTLLIAIIAVLLGQLVFRRLEGRFAQDL
ncbi:MAG: ABC transporter permease [Actinobacteria bacterium]|nr:ABC transporter permease [Actinomycetota bacterium]